MSKLSIIVAVHNQLGHNQLFLEGIQRYTTGPYQVIVVDSHSTDGSAEFSEANRNIIFQTVSSLSIGLTRVW